MKTKFLLLLVFLPLLATAQTETKLLVRLLDTRLKPLVNTKVTITEIETREQKVANTNNQGTVSFHLKSGDIWQIEALDIQNYPMWRIRMVENRIVEMKRTFTYDVEKYEWEMTAPANREVMDIKTVVSQSGENDKPTKELAIARVVLRRKSGDFLQNFPVKLFSKKQETIFEGKTNLKGVAYFKVPINDTYDIELEDMERFSYVKIPNRSGSYYRKMTFEPMNFTETVKNDTIKQNLPADITPTSARQLVKVTYRMGGEIFGNQDVHLKDDRGIVYLNKTDNAGLAKFMLHMGRTYYYVMSVSGILEEVQEVIDLKYSFGIGQATRTVIIDPAFKPRETDLKLAIPKSEDDLNQLFGANGLMFSNFKNLSVPYFAKSYLVYEDPNDAIGIKKGLLMTTGSVLKAIGPNDLPGASFQNSYYLVEGIPKALLPAETGTAKSGEKKKGFGAYDLCWLEFDVKPAGNELIFEYVFASEEYPEYLNFDDAFGIFVEGKNMDGEKNWATTPSNSDNVSVGHVNDKKHSELYWANDKEDKPSFKTWQYDGFTNKLEKRIKVEAGETYHVKLLIFDRRDGIYDSGVFIGMKSE